MASVTNNRSTRATAWAPLTGVLFVVLTVASFLIAGEPPDTDASVREVVEFYSDNDSQNMIASVVASLAAVSLVFFAASLRRALRQGENGAGVLSAVAFGGGVVAATGIATDAAIHFALADVADDINPASVQALHALWSDFFFPMVVGMAALVLATGLAALRTRIIPVWLAWVGIALFVVFFTPAGFVAFIGSALWVLIVSVLLYRQERAVAI